MTPEAKEIIKDTKVTKSDALKLSRLAPEQQTEAASRLVSGDIHSVDEYQPPPAVPEPPAKAPPKAEQQALFPPAEVSYSNPSSIRTSIQRMSPVSPEEIIRLGRVETDVGLHFARIILDKYNDGGAKFPYRFKG